MYNAFFGFKKAPFASRRDPAVFYRSGQHDASLRGLLFAVRSQMGLIFLTGEPGTGKTTVLECVRESLESENFPCAFLRDPRISVDQFFHAIAADLDLQCKEASTYEVFSALAQLVTQQARRRRSVVLIVDEGHNLPTDVFNEIIHIANLRDEKLKIQTIVAGRPELLPMLEALNLEPLDQPALSRTLHPFTAAETKEYIEFRLARSGMPEQTIFSTEAMQEIYDQTSGLAPAIHELCEQLLLAAFSATSKVCTPELFDQVLHEPYGQTSKILETTPTVVLEPSIDLARSDVHSVPDPPPMQTALLPLTLALIPRGPKPVPAIKNERWDPQSSALLPVLPRGNSARLVAGLAMGSATPMRPANGVKGNWGMCRRVHPDSSSTARLSIVSIAFTDFHLIPPTFSEMEVYIAQASRIPAGPPIPVECNAIWKRPVSTGASLSAVPGASALQPKWPLMGLHPAGTVNWPHVPVAPFQVAKDNPAPSRAIEAVRLDLEKLENCVKPALPGELAVSLHQLPLASSVPLLSMDDYMRPRTQAVCAPVGAQLFSIAWAPTFQLIPALQLQPAGVMQWPRVPIMHKIKSQRFSPRAGGDVAMVGGNANPRRLAPASEFPAFHQPSIQLQNNPLPLVPSVPPSPPSPATPPASFSNILPCHQKRCPPSKLEPVNPLTPSLLLLPRWAPATYTTSTETAIPIPSQRRWPLGLAITILIGLALYGAPVAMRTTADAVHQGWQQARHAVLNRAAVALDEDFRAGLNTWTNRRGNPPSWPRDAAGFVHPAALALYRPSLGLVDYQMRFVGTIDKKGLSWVVRAADFKNYYAVGLAVLKPGPIPSIGVIRYAVINGKARNTVITPLVMRAESDSVYRVSLDIHGDRFTLAVQDHLVDYWSEPKLRQGGIGFFSDQDAGSGVTDVQVRGQYDMVGRLCAFLLTSGFSPDRF